MSLIPFELLSISSAKKTILFALYNPFEVLAFTFLQALHIKYFSNAQIISIF
jgi:hypothetical protein